MPDDTGPLGGRLSFTQPRLVRQPVEKLFQLLIRKPSPVIVGNVDPPHAIEEDVPQNDLTETAAQTPRRIGRKPHSLVDHMPAKLPQLIKKRLFNKLVFRHNQSK
jgi:hypothetical protein